MCEYFPKHNNCKVYKSCILSNICNHKELILSNDKDNDKCDICEINTNKLIYKNCCSKNICICCESIHFHNHYYCSHCNECLYKPHAYCQNRNEEGEYICSGKLRHHEEASGKCHFTCTCPIKKFDRKYTMNQKYYKLEKNIKFHNINIQKKFLCQKIKKNMIINGNKKCYICHENNIIISNNKKYKDICNVCFINI